MLPRQLVLLAVFKLSLRVRLPLQLQPSIPPALLTLLLLSPLKTTSRRQQALGMYPELVDVTVH